MLAIILLTILILGTLEACDQALNETINHFKALDVLVNNAGVMFTDNLENFSEEHFDVSMNVNVKSALRLSQKSVEWLQASTVKSIVNVSSIAGLRAYPGSLPYKISKAECSKIRKKCNFVKSHYSSQCVKW